MVSKGTAVFEGEPFVYVLNHRHLRNHCDYCLKRVDIKKCMGCNYIGYCNEECQKHGWFSHKYECKHLQRFPGELVNDDIRLFTRIIRKLKKKSKRNAFFNLESRVDLFKSDKPRMAMFERLCSDLKDFIGEHRLPEMDEMLQIYCRICLNAFTITDIDLQHIGHAIYLFPKTIKHSCKPNTTYAHYGKTIIITSLEDFTEFNWEQLTISYIDTMQSTKNRQAILKERYYYDCNCLKCMELERDALCPNKNCQSACNIDEKCCPKCKTELENKLKIAYYNAIKLAEENIDLYENKYNLKLFQFCVKNLKDVVHPTHYIYIRMLEKLHVFEENNRHWLRCMNYLTEIIKGYREHYSEFSFAMGALYYKMAKLQLLIEDSDAFYENIKTVKQIFLYLFAKNGHNYVEELATKIVMELARPDQIRELF